MNNKINTSFPILPLQPQKSPSKANLKEVADFQTNLAEQIAKQEKLKFSAHAQKRLTERNIQLGASELEEIEKAVQKAQAKGVRDSLVLYGDLALITSIKNKTVVTAIDGQSIQDHIFTNIDSAIIVKKQ